MKGRHALSRTLLTFATLGILTTTAAAQNCICAKYPMYPVAGNGWFHYAIVHTPGTCAILYPTGHIDGYTVGENCTSPACGNCSSLAGEPLEATRTVPSFFVGALDSSPPSYDSLDAPGKIKQFLKDTAPGGTTSHKYDTMTFKRAFDTVYTKPVCLRLIRKVDDVEEVFYAVVWRVTLAGGPSAVHGFVGAEVDEKPAGVSALVPFEVCSVVDTQHDSMGSPVHVKLPGLLQAKFSKNPGNPLGEATAFIRLHHTTKNLNASFPECH